MSLVYRLWKPLTDERWPHRRCSTSDRASRRHLAKPPPRRSFIPDPVVVCAIVQFREKCMTRLPSAKNVASPTPKARCRLRLDFTPPPGPNGAVGGRARGCHCSRIPSRWCFSRRARATVLTTELGTPQLPPPVAPTELHPPRATEPRGAVVAAWHWTVQLDRVRCGEPDAVVAVRGRVRPRGRARLA